MSWMPSRSFAERYDNLLAIGGHPAVDMPPHVVEAAARAAERPAYAPTLGSPPLREAIAALHETSADCVLVTVGGMQALYLVAQVYGARAVSHAPAFFFPQVVEAAGGTCAVAYDWDEYAAAIGADTTLAIVNTPVNPTGYVFRRHDLDAIASAVADTEALLVSDEAYFGLTYDGLEHLSPASHPDLRCAHRAARLDRGCSCRPCRDAATRDRGRERERQAARGAAGWRRVRLGGGRR